MKRNQVLFSVVFGLSMILGVSAHAAEQTGVKECRTVASNVELTAERLLASGCEFVRKDADGVDVYSCQGREVRAKSAK